MILSFNFRNQTKHLKILNTVNFFLNVFPDYWPVLTFYLSLSEEEDNFCKKNNFKKLWDRTDTSYRSRNFNNVAK